MTGSLGCAGDEVFRRPRPPLRHINDMSGVFLLNTLAGHISPRQALDTCLLFRTIRIIRKNVARRKMDSSESDLQRAAAKLHKTRNTIDAASRVLKDALEKKSLVRTVIGAVLLLGLSNISFAVFTGISLWYALHLQPAYFASDNGRIFPLVPLSVPYVKQSDVIKFAKETMEASNSLDFSHYQAQMEAVRPRYTREAFADYIKGMKSNGTLALIISKRMNLTSATGTGVLLEEGNLDGVYQWVVKFPLSLKMVGQNTELSEQKLYAMVRVVRVSTLDNIQGIGVRSIVTKPQ